MLARQPAQQEHGTASGADVCCGWMTYNVPRSMQQRRKQADKDMSVKINAFLL